MVVVSFLSIAHVLSKSTRYRSRNPDLDHTFMGHCPSCWHGRWLWRAAYDQLMRVVHPTKRKHGSIRGSRAYEMSSLQKGTPGSITVTESLEALAVTQALSKSRLVRLLSAYPFVVSLAEHSHHVDILNLALTCKEVYQKVLGCTRNDLQYIIRKTCRHLATSCSACGIKVCQVGISVPVLDITVS
ncbi:hypothetical protein VTN77DRAFT_1755 [Rasamsonia byssochlamydoides]|uniref:uncharacterized protein n=1 Tax=Rasamsonia byssochlamydoides TaxID=89139 RepID=UPI0037421CB3